MTTERFNELINGPLHHPMPMFAITRLALALKAVVDATGEAGDAALEDHCAQREAQDNQNAEGYEENDEYEEDDIPY